MEAWLHDMRVLKEQEEAATQDAALKGKMWGEVRATILPHWGGGGVEGGREREERGGRGACATE